MASALTEFSSELKSDVPGGQAQRIAQHGADTSACGARARIPPIGDAPGGYARSRRRSAAHSGLLGSIGTLVRLLPGQGQNTVSEAASTADRTAWGTHKRMRRVRSDSVRRARPGGLCAPAAPPTAAQRSPHAGLGTCAAHPTSPRRKALRTRADTTISRERPTHARTRRGRSYSARWARPEGLCALTLRTGCAPCAGRANLQPAAGSRARGDDSTRERSRKL